ncbi:MAG: STAS domain-containing protein [Pseudomonadota bacterium]
MDKNACEVACSEQTLTIRGDLTLSSVQYALEQIQRLSSRAGSTCLVETLDLSHVRACDSSAVALVLELRRRGLQRVIHPPAAFLAIVHACQLDALFPHLAQNRGSA